MSKAALYLDEAKERLLLSSDYGLAKALGVRKQRVQEWRSGRATPDAYACTRLAIVLEKDPAQVIAEIHAEADKDDERRSFWRSFLSRARTAAAILCTLASICSAIYGAGHTESRSAFRRPRLAA